MFGIIFAPFCMGFTAFVVFCFFGVVVVVIIVLVGVAGIVGSGGASPPSPNAEKDRKYTSFRNNMFHDKRYGNLAVDSAAKFFS